MARIRTIKPEFWTAEQVMECSPTARLLFIGVWNFCDDGGNHPASCKTLKAEVFPGDDITAAEIDALVGELLTNDLLVEYEAAGKRYWHVTGWHHQKIEKPNFKHPKPTDGGILRPVADESPNDRRPVADHSTPEGKGGEGRGEERKGVNPPPHPARAREVDEAFPMDAGWEPSPHFGTAARSAGLLVSDPAEVAAALAEFRLYWLTQPATVRTQHEWDHALIRSLKADRLRATQAPKARASPSRSQREQAVAWANELMGRGQGNERDDGTIEVPDGAAGQLGFYSDPG